MDNEVPKTPVPRRQLVKAAAWSVPVLAASVAVPAAAASNLPPCAEPNQLRNQGKWTVYGPKGNGSGYFGIGPTGGNVPVMWYKPGYTLYFNWVWKPAAGETGHIVAGTKFYVGLGGNVRLDEFALESATRPTVEGVPTGYMRYVATHAGTTKGPRFEFEATRDFTPTGSITFANGRFRAVNQPPADRTSYYTFGATAYVSSITVDGCPVQMGTTIRGSEWLGLADTTSPSCDYKIANAQVMANPGAYGIITP